MLGIFPEDAQVCCCWLPVLLTACCLGTAACYLWTSFCLLLAACYLLFAVLPTICKCSSLPFTCACCRSALLNATQWLMRSDTYVAACSLAHLPHFSLLTPHSSLLSTCYLLSRSLLLATHSLLQTAHPQMPWSMHDLQLAPNCTPTAE